MDTVDPLGRPRYVQTYTDIYIHTYIQIQGFWAIPTDHHLATHYAAIGTTHNAVDDGDITKGTKAASGLEAKKTVLAEMEANESIRQAAGIQRSGHLDLVSLFSVDKYINLASVGSIDVEITLEDNVVCCGGVGDVSYSLSQVFLTVDTVPMSSPYLSVLNQALASPGGLALDLEQYRMWSFDIVAGSTSFQARIARRLQSLKSIYFFLVEQVSQDRTVLNKTSKFNACKVIFLSRRHVSNLLCFYSFKRTMSPSTVDNGFPRLSKQPPLIAPKPSAS